MPDNQLIIELNQQPIELCKLLKVANLVGGGGEAKIVISEGYVFVNGEVEYQKRKKIYHEDVIEFNGDLLQVIVNESLNDDSDTEYLKSQANQTESAKTPDKKTQTEREPKKRRPISF